jgi:cyclopropane-fatty-acyl-phospholipid synthase
LENAVSVAEKVFSKVNDKVSQLRMDSHTSELFRKQGLYGLGESYVEGLWNAERLDDLLFRLITQQEVAGPHMSRRLAAYVLKEKLFNPQRGDGVFEVADRHYDIGNDLFEIMLDSTMTYTCGYWKEARTLDAAQIAKLDLSCRKLKLEKGMRVLDIGCGWGNFAKFAAVRFGVSVVGVTVAK